MFYESPEDLIDAHVDYFGAGLAADWEGQRRLLGFA
ncbi:MAG: hypothetical protein QOH47_2540 [Sphingomonadales bacterium]|jgi:hypothetical protein|nr:hypothetical protein [Sphingomonadales bacterium]